MIIRRKVTLSNKQKPKKFLSKKVLVWFFIGFVVMVQIFFTIQTATMGATLANLEERQDELVRENGEYMDSLVKSTSLSELKEKADLLGFIKSENSIYLSTEKVVAKAN